MTAVVRQNAPEIPVVALMVDAPACDPKSSAYLLAAAYARFPPQTVFLCIVDPGVGGDRTPVVLTVDERHFVGPDNGLFELVVRHARSPCTCQEISWIPAALSETFHGRDLFAPVAARLARGLPVEFAADDIAVSRHLDWPDDLAQIVHIDRYGNAVTGIRAAALSSGATLVVGPHQITCARTFSDVPPAGTFWYNNSNGLVEIAVNLGRADRQLGVEVGSAIQIF